MANTLESKLYLGSTLIGGAGSVADRILARLAAAASGPVRMVFSGSSTTAGSNASSAANRYVNRLVANAQAAYPSGLGSEAAVLASTSASFPAPATTPGIVGYNVGESGTVATNFLTSAEITALGALNPAVWFVMIGSNDFKNNVDPAAYKSTLVSKLSEARAAAPQCLFVLVHSYQRLDVSSPTYSWASYGTALAEIAAANPNNTMFINSSMAYVPLGIPGSDPADLIDTDNIHQRDAGHAFCAELLRLALRIPSIIVIASPGDVTAPTVPTGLTAGTPSATTVPLSWTASTDAVGVTGYKVYRGGVFVANVSGTSYTVTGLSASTAYSFTVTAFDAAGNESAASSSVSVTTATDVPTNGRVTSDSFASDTTNVAARTSDAANGGAARAYSGDSNNFATNGGTLIRGATKGASFVGWAETQMNCEIGVTLVALPTGANNVIDIHRSGSTGTSAQDAYRLNITPAGAVTLQKRVSGTVTTILSSMPTAAAGEVWALRYINGTLEVRRNNTVVGSVTDNSITTIGYAGLAASASLTATTLDNLYLDNVA